MSAIENDGIAATLNVVKESHENLSEEIGTTTGPIA